MRGGTTETLPRVFLIQVMVGGGRPRSNDHNGAGAKPGPLGVCRMPRRRRNLVPLLVGLWSLATILAAASPLCAGPGHLRAVMSAAAAAGHPHGDEAGHCCARLPDLRAFVPVCASARAAASPAHATHPAARALGGVPSSPPPRMPPTLRRGGAPPPVYLLTLRLRE